MKQKNWMKSLKNIKKTNFFFSSFKNLFIIVIIIYPIKITIKLIKIFLLYYKQ